jgi:tetratricopeptide (TPR) repeat protein
MTIAIVIGIILIVFIGIIYYFTSAPKRMLKIIYKETKKIVMEIVNLTGKSCYDEEKLFSIMCQILSLDKETLPQNLKDHLKQYSTCIEAICCNIILNIRLQLSMGLRCAQCIGIINDCLAFHGVEPCSINIRESLLKNLDLFDLYKTDPNLFKFREPKNLKKYSNVDKIKELIAKSEKLITGNKYFDAINICNEIININQNLVIGYLNRGYAFMKLNENDHALDDFSKIIEINPNDANVYSLRSGIFLAKNEKEKAINDLTKYLELKQDDPMGFFQRGSTYADLHKFELAINDLNKALLMDKTHADWYMCRAWCHAKMNNTVLFDKDIEEAKKLNPKIAERFKR